jgi:hypothetical protein
MKPKSAPSSPPPRRAVPLLVACLVTASPSLAAVSTPVEKWRNGGCFSSWCQTGWYSSPAVADLDGDGQSEVIWGAYDLVVLRGTDGAPQNPRRPYWAGLRSDVAGISCRLSEFATSISSPR